MPLLVALAGCGGDDESCVVGSAVGCGTGLVCEEVTGRGGGTCLAPVVVRGTVRDGSNDAPVAGARVLVVDGDGKPIAAAATSDAGGSYEIRVVAPREASFAPRALRFTVAAAAPGFGIAPNPWRDAVVVDLATAQPTALEDKLVVASPGTDVTLIAFTGGPGRGVITGHVDVPAGVGPVWVVAESTEDLGRPLGTAGLVDASGDYAIYDLPPAQLSVRGYARGQSFGERRIGLNVGEMTVVDLRPDGALPAATVSGRADLAAAGTAQVELVIASTWDARTSAGLDLGLRATTSSDGSYSIAGVPAGTYLVVNRAADDLVPVGTLPRVTVAGADTAVETRLRLVPAIAVRSPGAGAQPEATGATPTLSWMDDDAEASYRVRVVNLAGVELFNRSEPARAGGDPSVLFAGSLVHGMLYRLTVEALDATGATITRTEDRRGIFFPQ